MATNKDTFDAIASTWYGVRHWPLLRRELEELAQRWRSGSIANLGCGTGADFLPFARSFHLVGLDFSRGMLRESTRYLATHELSADLVQGELTLLPFADATFDHAVGIACYHHLQELRDRRRALSELRRILRPGGEAFVTVWNHAQPRFHALPQDQSIPWHAGGVTFQRTYHLFTVEELATEVTTGGFEIVKLHYGSRRDAPAEEDARNICVLLRRPAGA